MPEAGVPSPAGRDMSVALWSFVILLVLITASGAMAVIRKKKTTSDYLVASRNVKPWLAALSTVATNNSGFMFVGMIAYTYRRGLEAVWLMAGWVLGDLLAWLVIHPRLRRASAEQNVDSLPGLLARSGSGHMRPVAICGGLITMAFLGVYAAAQLKAGSTALHALLGWDMSVGCLIGIAIVILYSYAGGIRADIWTDAAQSLAMIVSMAMILIAGYIEIGGLPALFGNLADQDERLVAWLPQDRTFGAVPFILGYAFAGVGAAGQPHLMTRIMSIESNTAIRSACAYYFAWYVPFFIVSIGVGLYCRAILPDLAQAPLAAQMREPTELALPLITMELLPQVFVGLALAGLFAATVSTADSQIIVSSGALTQDVAPRWKDSYLASKVGTFSISALSLAIALFAPEGVFGLVVVAWSAMAASLLPLLLIHLFRLPIGTTTALLMMGTAVAVVSVWHVSPYSDDVFKALPGTLAAALVYAGARVGDRWLGSTPAGATSRPDKAHEREA